MVYPWQDLRVQALFKDPRFLLPIKEKIDADRINLFGYFDQQGWSEQCAKVGVVDIGWRGTIQDNLAYLFPNTKVFGYYLGLQQFLNSQPENCIKSAFCVDINHSNEHYGLLDELSLMEMLCNSPNGSVSGYVQDADKGILATRIVDVGENAVHENFVSHFQQGVLFVSSRWSDYIDNHVIVSSELKEIACRIWGELVTQPSLDLSQSYAALNHNEVFGVGEFVNKSRVPSIGELCFGFFLRKKDKMLFFIFDKING